MRQSSFLEKFLLFLVLLLALALSPFFIFFYPYYKFRKAKKTRYFFSRLQKEWYPKKKHVIFVYSESKIWKDYFEINLIPHIKEHAIILNWSKRHETIKNDEAFAWDLVKFFKRGWTYPKAFIFRGETCEQIDFHDEYIKMIKSGRGNYKQIEENFLQQVHSL